MNTTTGPRLTVRNKVGLVMAGLLGAGDILGPSPAGVAATLLVQGLPAWIYVLAAALVTANITAVILVLSRPAAPPLPGQATGRGMGAASGGGAT
jgi:hypothetical protein